MTLRVRAMRFLVFPLSVMLAGCHGSFEPGQAADEWTRTYPLSEGGQLQIDNTNGVVEIEGVAGATVEVRADRTARAATDSAARELLSHISIKEEVTPARISIETGRTGAFSIVSGYEVQYHVRVPMTAAVRVTTTNGRILLTGLSGETTASTTNGGVSGRALAGRFAATSTNGQLDVEMAALGPNGVELRATNGRVLLTVPVDAGADLNASVTNGDISVTGLKFEATDQSARHLSARINGGGTPITLATTNGAIRVAAP
jgi:DUF4097 and DUF4098 domain-containing protein YvlB